MDNSIPLSTERLDVPELNTKMNLRPSPFRRFTQDFFWRALPLACLVISLTATSSYAGGAVVAWGDNSALQSQVPPGLTDAQAVSAGFLHSVALKSDGTVVSWGYNFFGQTNTPPNLSNVTAVSAGYSQTLALKSDGTIVGWGSPSVPAGLTTITAIAAGWDHALALNSNGTVTAWGSQTTVSSSATNIVAISAGNGFSLALRLDGIVVAWGDNSYGKTNVPASLSNVVAIAAGEDHALALKGDGTVVAWGGNYAGQATVPPGLSNIVSVAAGALHSLALKSDGTLVAWGDNTHNQSTIQAGLSGYFGIAGGGYHSVAVKGNGSPVILVQPTSQRIATGRTLNLPVLAAGSQPIGYQWYRNGTNLIPGQTNSLLSLTNIQLSDSGSYRAVVGNFAGSVTSAVAVVTVIVSPPVVLVQPQAQNTFCGDTANFLISIDGSSPLRYQWRYEGAPIAGATQSTLVLSNVVPAKAGGYSVVVTNGSGAITSTVANLSVPIEPPFITSPLAVSAKQGQLFGYQVTGLHTPISFAASFLPLGLTINSNGFISGVPSESGTFGAPITTINACTYDTETLVININSSAPVITSPLSVIGTEESGFTYQITATESPTSFGATGLPLGLTLNQTNGLISGVSVYAGTFDATIYASNSWGFGSATLHFSFANETIGALSIANVTYTYSSPYLLDFQFALRDSDDPSTGRAVVADPRLFTVVCKEDDVPISALETAVISERGSSKLLKAYLVLDFTESIASLVNGDSNGDGISDAVENMVGGAQEFVKQQAADAQIGVYEFHREDLAPQKVIGLTTDKALLNRSIAGIWTNYVQSFPAGSRCWDGLVAAIAGLGATNKDEQHFCIFVSDGKDESSTSTVADVITAATNNGVKVYCIGFGAELDAVTLQSITTATGGRYYTAASPADLAAGFAEIGKDLNGQYLLRWATLKRSTSTNSSFMPSFEITYQGLTALSPTNPVMTTTNITPPATNPPPPVTNFIIAPYFPAQHTGNVTIGSLRLVASGETLPKSVILRAFYVPRYIRGFRIHYRANWPCTTSLLNTNAGQILYGWTMSETDDGAGGRFLQLTSPNPQSVTNSIPFGALGNLVRFSMRDMVDATNAFSSIGVDNTIYAGTGGQSFIIENTNSFQVIYGLLPYGTPVPWLVAHGIFSNFVAAEVADPDGDGALTWQEYQANTDPLSSTSKFFIRRITQAPDGRFQILMTTASNRTYRVDSSADLVSWQTVQDNIAGTGSDVLVVDTRFQPGVTKLFYRVQVR